MLNYIKKKIWDDEHKVVRQNVYLNETDILFWAQRNFIYKWYPDYDHSLFINREDLPYDIDHIIPSDFFMMRGVLNSDKLPEIFRHYKWTVPNNIGNYRFWPKELNRADQAKGLKDKFLLGDLTTKTKGYNYREDLGLGTVSDVQAASFLYNPQDWENVPYSKYQWGTIGNFEHFILAVHNRGLALYKSLYEGIKWDDWLK